MKTIKVGNKTQRELAELIANSAEYPISLPVSDGKKALMYARTAIHKKIQGFPADKLFRSVTKKDRLIIYELEY